VINFFVTEIKIFLSSLMFFTRIPVFRFFEDREEYRVKNIKYLPAVGLLLGAVAAGVFSLSSEYLTDNNVCVALAMLSTIIMTGAFHEDGLADTADAIGGGYSKEKILTIMKDSRIGTFGTIALIAVLALRFFLLKSFPIKYIPVIFIASQSFSRIFPLFMVVSLPYVSETNSAKSKFVSKGIVFSALVFGVLIGLTSILFVTFNFWVYLIFIPMFFIFLCLRKYFKDAVDGYTGDILGATQQIFEILFLINLSVIWKYI
jgi:adenosylcobinamide-GDP ribazoletransferase